MNGYVEEIRVKEDGQREGGADINDDVLDDTTWSSRVLLYTFSLFFICLGGKK